MSDDGLGLWSDIPLSRLEIEKRCKDKKRRAVDSLRRAVGNFGYYPRGQAEILFRAADIMK